MNKRAFTVPNWMLGVLLVVIILVIVLAFLLTTYSGGLSEFTQTKIIPAFGG